MNYSYAHMLCRPVRIQQQDVILIQDIVGAVPVTEQHEYVEICKASNTCASIHMRESDLENMRRLYPKIPVYGLWHILVASGKVDVHVCLQVVSTTEFDGHYIHSDVGRILYSGNYDAGFFAADTGFRLSNAVEIEGTLEDLSLPNTPAMLAREILTQKRQRYRGSFFLFAGVALLMCFIGFVMDFSLQMYSEQDFSSIVEKEKHLKKIAHNLKNLSQNRLVENPNQAQQLHRLALIFNDFEDIQVDSQILMKSSRVTLTVASVENPALLYQFVNSEIQPDGRWLLIVNLKG